MGYTHQLSLFYRIKHVWHCPFWNICWTPEPATYSNAYACDDDAGPTDTQESTLSNNKFIPAIFLRPCLALYALYKRVFFSWSPHTCTLCPMFSLDPSVVGLVPPCTYWRKDTIIRLCTSHTCVTWSAKWVFTVRRSGGLDCTPHFFKHGLLLVVTEHATNECESCDKHTWQWSIITTHPSLTHSVWVECFLYMSPYLPWHNTTKPLTQERSYSAPGTECVFHSLYSHQHSDF